jgi:hypothetical protein
MKVGDRVQIVALPKVLPEGMGTRELFEACFGHVFPIIDIEGKLMELHVGETVGEPSYMHAIWIERDHIRLADG